ncbi:hypothetical protein RND71_004236 [Anisodus tanguticus]|uniref:Uncharacterized protein n=1 Tax=Anisodus tanguticus TaxID=243964 RepID=A0AAE1SX92_9SOLA|nr:hypothetical protein RND71_004236 [Anisodus tanguticus]
MDITALFARLYMEDVIKQDMVQEYSCVTPKGKRFRIPEKLSCPPAPKKRRPVAAAKCLSKRRRLLDDDFSS